MLLFFLMITRPPISTRTDTLFPYTTLFRSGTDHAFQLTGPAPDRSVPAWPAVVRRALSGHGRDPGLQRSPGHRLPATPASGRDLIAGRPGVRTHPGRGQHPHRSGGARGSIAPGGGTRQPIPGKIGRAPV